MKILIIIPVYNEEKKLRRSLNSYLNQTYPINQITIVNDGSSDNSSQIIKEYSKKYKSINYISKDNFKSYAKPGKKIIKAFNYGLERSIKNYDLIGKFDADIILPNNYFKRMVEIFTKDIKLGMCSGILASKQKNQLKIENEYSKNHVRGAIKLYRRNAFEKIGGLYESMGWDTLDELKMEYFKFKIYVDQKLICIHSRETGIRYKKEKFIKQGRVMYLLGYDFILCVLGSIKFSIKNKSIFPFFRSIYGYSISSIKGETKIVSNNFSKFVRRYRYKNIFHKIKKWGKY